jgi:benzoylformate decarboxylase
MDARLTPFVDALQSPGKIRLRTTRKARKAFRGEDAFIWRILMRGIEALLEVLAGAGVRHLFANPGSTELPLNDALVNDARFQYILGLHELPLVAMADGYAQASGGLGAACVHICCGLGNAMGMLYNAYTAGTPLLLLAGQQDRRLRLGEPVLEGDMVSVARPWTKWAAEVQRVEDIPAAVRRAAQVALTPPTAPVFLALPVDVQMEEVAGLDLTPPCIPDRRIRPPLEALRRAAELLAGAQRPAILAGSRVVESGASGELVALAEQLGAPVWAEQQTHHGRLPIPGGHPLYLGPVPLWTPDIRQRLAEYDVILAVGIKLLRLYIYHEPAPPIPQHVKVIHLDANPWEVGKNYPLEVGLLGDPKAGLMELSLLVAARQTPAQVQAARERVAGYAARRAAERAALVAEIAAQGGERPMTPQAMLGAVAAALPPNAAVIEESATTHQGILERLGALADPAGHFAHRGWALGWGLGCAIGVKLAWPERPVMALLGDGAAMYGIQGLWTAAHHRIPVTFCIANNRQYKILKVVGDVMALPEMGKRNYVGMDLVEPEVDFVGMARALGVRAERIVAPEELMERLRESLAGDEPRLLDVTIAP